MSRAWVSRISKIAVWGAVLYGSSGLLCQTASTKPEAPAAAAESAYNPHMNFDVVSIRESREGNYSYIDNMPTSSYYHAEHVAAVSFLLSGYQVKLLQQFENVPGWARSVRYDMTAKSDDATDEALAKLSEIDAYAEKRHMMRSMLAERFKLQIHPETRVTTTYELVATPRAAKGIMPVQGEIAKTVSTCDIHYSRKGREVESKGCPFSIFLHHIQQELGTDVVDRTGFSGMYAYHLMWAPSEMPIREGEERYPSMVDAVSEQLGLELKQTKGPVTFWVIDHIERPTPN